jgi:hypothetical protein
VFKPAVKHGVDGKKKDILLTMLTKNDYFGEIALIEKTTREPQLHLALAPVYL